jgi:plasmid stability protein
MGKIVIEGLDETTIAALSDRAQARSTTVEHEVAELIRDAVRTWRRERRLEIIDRISGMTPKGVRQTDSTLLIREDRDR